MEIIPPYLRIYQQNLIDLENAFPYLKVPKPKAVRKPKLTDTHIAAFYILSYKTNTKVLSLSECPNFMHASKSYPHILQNHPRRSKAFSCFPL